MLFVLSNANAFAKKKSVPAVADPLLVAAREHDPYWINARKEAYKSVPELIAQHNEELSRSIARTQLIRGDTSKKQIALTFDDGPHSKYTPKILEILRRYNIKATFFLVGELAERNPALVKAEIGGGHNVGNHTYHHVNLTRIPSGYVATEIKACGLVLCNITGKAPHLFRPPGGDYDDNVAQVAEALGYKLILWTDDPGDYASPGDDIITQRIVDKAEPGGIILIHDGVKETIDILPKVIQTLKDKGYEFVTIDEMMRSK
jgi:polysaccharide deacetylase family sporulation protein PdaB